MVQSEGSHSVFLIVQRLGSGTGGEQTWLGVVRAIIMAGGKKMHALFGPRHTAGRMPRGRSKECAFSKHSLPLPRTGRGSCIKLCATPLHCLMP